MRHICIVGTGAAGWMTALWARFSPIEKITVIGSPEILPIGVGESNTMLFVKFLKSQNLNLAEFITKCDATAKLGVFYKNWSKNDFIHNFKGAETWDKFSLKSTTYFQSFGNKDPNIPFHEYYANDLFKTIQNNHIFLDEQKYYEMSYHFDAGKFIDYLELSFNKDTNNKETQVIKKTVIDCVFSSEDKIEKVILNDGTVIEADYFIFATGSSKFNEKILKIQYESFSDVLLTNKAWVYPLEYTDKRNQFHPYTVAKTMKYGWRWITPTWSRIGTGYVFSDRHISADEACKEFLDDIGDHTISPRLVEFTPRYSKKTFYDNFCVIGMANGFLEPLDAPGLSLTIQTILGLKSIFSQSYYLNGDDVKYYYNQSSNELMVENYKQWISFILTQYKTCHRNDTAFWTDHKKVKYDHYENIMKSLGTSAHYTDKNNHNIKNMDMFYHTLSAKDINWELPYDRKPFVIPKIQSTTIHHEDYIQLFYDHITLRG